MTRGQHASHGLPGSAQPQSRVLLPYFLRNLYLTLGLAGPLPQPPEKAGHRQQEIKGYNTGQVSREGLKVNTLVIKWGEGRTPWQKSLSSAWAPSTQHGEAGEWTRLDSLTPSFPALSSFVVRHWSPSSSAKSLGFPGCLWNLSRMITGPAVRNHFEYENN